MRPKQELARPKTKDQKPTTKDQILNDYLLPDLRDRNENNA